jgi:hypothetical protein
MNRFRLLAFGAMLIAAWTAPAQQAPTAPVGVDKGNNGQPSAEDGAPTVEQQLNVLAEKLDLTADQQARITPILRDLHDATLKLMQDTTLSREERLALVRPQRYKANEQIHEILSEDQKKKLDQYLGGPHSEMHGNLSGAVSPQQQPQK